MATRAALLMLAGVCALALAGCGDDRGEQAARLPHALADRLADRADRVAARLEAGEPCNALAEADRLRVDAQEAIVAGRIPAAAQAPLEDAIASLKAAIVCEPEAPPAASTGEEAETNGEEAEEDDDKPGKRKGQDKRDDKKKHGQEGED